jgi:hypothetical protein
VTDHTHRVVGKAHRRSAAASAVTDERRAATNGPVVEYDPGDLITPTDAELRSFPFRFEELAGDDVAGGDESDGDDAAVPDEFTQDDLAGFGYQTLRGLAARYDDINGNWGGDRLRAELARHASDAEA